MATVPVLIHPQMKRNGHQVYMDPLCDPMAGRPLTQGDLPSILCTNYLIVASKTWTVESLSNETVLITNLTAFWNSEEFPIIFKKRNRNRYDSLKRNKGYKMAGPGPRHLSVCMCFASRGSRGTKGGTAQLSFRGRPRTDGEPRPPTQDPHLQMAKL